MTGPPLLPITFGRATGQPADMLPRHRHDGANLAVVLSGGYLEAGDYGRRRVSAGDVLTHSAFEAHLNRFSRPGTQVLSLPLPGHHDLPVRGTVKDPDALVRLTAKDAREALEMFMETFVPWAREEEDWPDLLAARLAQQPAVCLREWADQLGIAQTSVSRGFRLAYGTSPRRFRAEWRARRAWQAIVKGDQPLAQIAFDCGFTDQPHMNRAVVALTGRPPGAWRAKVNSVQDRRIVTA